MITALTTTNGGAIQDMLDDLHNRRDCNRDEVLITYDHLNLP